MDISLSRQQKNALGEIVRRQCGEARLHRRARMVLLAAAGETISSIARKVGTARCRVGEWLGRFERHGVEALGDLPRSGRPPEITPIERHQVIAVACRSPMDFGLQRTLWSHATLRDALLSAGLVRSVSTSTIGRILDDAEIKPHRVKMRCTCLPGRRREKRARPASPAVVRPELVAPRGSRASPCRLPPRRSAIWRPALTDGPRPVRAAGEGRPPDETMPRDAAASGPVTSAHRGARVTCGPGPRGILPRGLQERPRIAGPRRHGPGKQVRCGVTAPTPCSGRRCRRSSSSTSVRPPASPS